MKNNQGKIPYPFLPIPHWLKDMLKITMVSKRESQAIWIIMDKTFGVAKSPFTCERKEYAHIGEAYVAKGTDMQESNASRTLTQLSKRKIIIKGKSGIKINEKVGEWLLSDLSKTVISTKRTLSNSISKVIRNDNNSLSEMITIKEPRNFKKEAINPKKEDRKEEAEYEEKIRQSHMEGKRRREEENRASDETINRVRNEWLEKEKQRLIHNKEI